MSDRCQHLNFACNVNVFRLTETEDGPVKTFTAEVKVKCADCNMPFQWLGVPGGVSYNQPMKSADGLELRAPIIPVEEL